MLVHRRVTIRCSSWLSPTNSAHVEARTKGRPRCWRRAPPRSRRRLRPWVRPGGPHRWTSPMAMVETHRGWGQGDDFFQWDFMGIWWKSMGFHGDLMEINENSWGFHGDFMGIWWKSMGIHGDFMRIWQFSLGFTGILWGCYWVSWGTHGDLVKIVGIQWSLMGYVANGYPVTIGSKLMVGIDIFCEIPSCLSPCHVCWWNCKKLCNDGIDRYHPSS